MIPKPYSVVEEVVTEELVRTNQLPTNVSKLIEPLTISADKAELIELPKDAVLPTGFRFVDLYSLLDVLSILACPDKQTFPWWFKNYIN